MKRFLFLFIAFFGLVNAGSWCFEETANATSAGCTFGNGSYSFNGSWYYTSYIHNTTDGDYDTYAFPKARFGSLYLGGGFNVTYNLNSSINFTQFKWLVKHGLNNGTLWGNITENYTIPLTCYNSGQIILNFYLEIPPVGQYTSNYSLSCYTPSGKEYLENFTRYFFNDTAFYEEGLWAFDIGDSYAPPLIVDPTTYDICYAESANVSACTPQYNNGTYGVGNFTSSVFYNSSPWFYSRAYDTNWTAAALYYYPGYISERYYFNTSLINWIKVQNRVGCTIGNPANDRWYTINATLPTDCYNNPIYFNGGQTDNNITCFNGTINKSVYLGNWSGTVCSNGANPLYLGTADRALFENGLYINWTNHTGGASYYNLSATYNATNVSNNTMNELIPKTYSIVWAGAFANATLHWNGTTYAGTTTDNLTYSVNVTSGLIPSNITNVSYWWEGWTTGEVYVNTTVGNTSIYLSYWNTSQAINNSFPFEAEYIQTNYTIANLSNLATVTYHVTHFEFNGTEFLTATNTSNTSNFYYTYWVPVIGNASLNRTISANVSFCYNGTCRNISTQNQSYKTMGVIPSLNCTSGNFTSNASFWDSETMTPLNNVSVNVTMWYTFGNVTESLSGNYVTDSRGYFATCSNNNNTNLTGNITYVYTYIPGNYSTDSFFYSFPALDNVTDFINLTLTNLTNGSQVVFYVKNQDGESIPYFLIDIYKYNPLTLTYSFLKQVSTDIEGKGQTTLYISDSKYLFQVKNGSVNHTTFSFYEIICETGSTCPPYAIVLKIIQNITSDFFNYQAVDLNCSKASDNTSFSCTITTTNTSLYINETLSLCQWGALLCTNICNSTSTVQNDTLTCAIPNNASRYRWDFVVTTNLNRRIPLDNGIIEFPTRGLDLGAGGLILMFLISATLFFIGTFNPAVSVALAVVGVYFSNLMGLVYFSTPSIALISLAVIAGVIIYKVRT